MSHLSTALNRLTDRNGFKQADVVRETGLNKSVISRLFNAEKGTISDEDFLRLLQVFRKTPEEQGELIAARCMDARVGPGAQLVDIQVARSADPSRREKNWGYPEVHLSHDAERAFAWLRSQCPVNPELERHMIGFARLTGMNDVGDAS
jgi:transcriptional regulator with XRE-family HTH domain